MSYALAYGANECPPGWVDNAGTCVAPPDVQECPPQFAQKVPGHCWPATETACKDTFGTFFNPEEPDRCKKECPSGLVPDEHHVCRTPVLAAVANAVSSPLVLGGVALGVFAVVFVFRGGFR